MKKVLIAMLAATAVVGCAKKSDVPPTVEGKVPAAFVAVKPEGDATPISAARELAPGTDVILSGKVMGNKVPFVDALGVFILGDTEKLAPCSCSCPTPWDACCNTIDERVQATATIQILDEAGAILTHGVKGINGLKELSSVTVSGTVADNSSAAAFVVNAKAVHIEPEA
jgi:hypothetical protein